MPRLYAGFRTAIGCCLALIIAHYAGLEHPQWAGMSVWAAAQPLRGQLVEKSLFRFLGTVLGAFGGVLVVLAASVHLAGLVIGIALWIGLCTWISNLLRGLPAYCFAMAGYTAAIVALLDTAHNDQVWLLAADRMATVLIGVSIATVIGYAFSRQATRDGLRAEVLPLMAGALRFHAAGKADDHQSKALLARIALLDDSIEPHGAGSTSARRRLRATRRCLLTSLPLLLRPGTQRPEADIATLEAAAAALEALDLATAEQLLRDISAEGDQGRLISNMRLALSELAEIANPGPMPHAHRPALGVHRDWIGARQAGLRGFSAMAIVGAVWVLTGWSLGSFMVLGVALMITIFSSQESPIFMMRLVLLTQGIAGLAAVLAHVLFWPLASSPVELLIGLFPFVFAGAFVNSHNRTTLGALDYHLIYLLLSQPVANFTLDFGQEVLTALVVVSTPAISLAAFAFIFPVNLSRRRQQLLEMMHHDLADLARNPAAREEDLIWEARFYHRALRFIRMSDKLGIPDNSAVEISRAMLALSAAALHWRACLADDESLSARQKRVFRQALARVSLAERQPAESRRALLRLTAHLPIELSVSLLEAARALEQLEAVKFSSAKTAALRSRRMMV